MTHGMTKTLERRADLTKRLVASLEHLNQEDAISIISSFIILDTLEEIVDFQEGW